MVSKKNSRRNKGQASTGSFPWVLHDLLNNAEVGGYKTVVSWQPHGRAFRVHDQNIFVSTIMPIYFKQTQYKSFQRQLSLYGFRRLSYGLDSGAYYHSAFVRGRHSQCSKVSRKGGLDALQPTSGGVTQDEPNFYTYKWAAAVDKCNIWQYLKNHQKEVPKPDENKNKNNNASVATVVTPQLPPQPTQKTANVELCDIDPMAFDTKLDPILSLDLALVSDDSESGVHEDIRGFTFLQSKALSNKSALVIPAMSKSMFAETDILKSNFNTCAPVDIDAFEGLQFHSVQQGQAFDQRLHEPISEDFFVSVLP